MPAAPGARRAHLRAGAARGPGRRPDCTVVVALAGHELHLTGRLGVAAAADVRMALAEAVESGTGDLVVDVAGLLAVDATGLGVLVGGHRRAGRAGRTLVLRDVPPGVARLLFLTRLDRVLSTSRTATAV